MPAQVSLIWSEPPYDYKSMKEIHMAEGDPKAGITEIGIDSPQGIEDARKVRAAMHFDDGVLRLSRMGQVCMVRASSVTVKQMTEGWICQEMCSRPTWI